MASETRTAANARPASGPIRDLYDLVTGDEDARVCRDIDDAACREQPRNFFIHLASLTLTKIGDGIADAKTVLPWMLSSLGAPSVLIGLLVPIREAGALLPQMIVAAWIRRHAVRKWFWVVGSAGQGLALIGIAVAGISFSGTVAGTLIVTMLVLFSLSRGIASVASKDVLGKTIAKTRRGTLTGYASMASGIVVGLVGIAMVFEQGPGRSDLTLGWLFVLGGGLWLVAAGTFSRLAEEPGATEGGGNALSEALDQVGLLRDDQALRRFILARALLLSSALSAPFFVTLVQRHGHSVDTGSFRDLGLLVIAAGLASGLSAAVWGRFSDRSSRWVMVAAGGITGTVGLTVAALAALAPSHWPLGELVIIGFFILSVAHAGVRLGRKTYLVDMSTIDTRAAHVALSNTVIGILLLSGGAIGVVGDVLGTPIALAILALLALAGAATAYRLDDL